MSFSTTTIYPHKKAFLWKTTENYECPKCSKYIIRRELKVIFLRKARITLDGYLKEIPSECLKCECVCGFEWLEETYEQSLAREIPPTPTREEQIKTEVETELNVLLDPLAPFNNLNKAASTS